jgi:isoquinoline 1-oxidoreductase beta subunit
MSAAADSDIHTIEDSGATGLNRLEHVDTALDAGLLVHPEATREQFEGAVVFGMSIARSGEITAKNRVIQRSNFNDHPVARIKEVPI